MDAQMHDCVRRKFAVSIPVSTGSRARRLASSRASDRSTIISRRKTVKKSDYSFVQRGAAPVPFTSPCCDDTIPPSVPKQLAVYPAGCTSVIVTWAPSTDNSEVRRYRVYRNGRLLHEVPAPQTSASDAPLTPGHTYIYTVIA